MNKIDCEFNLGSEFEKETLRNTCVDAIQSVYTLPKNFTNNNNNNNCNQGNGTSLTGTAFGLFDSITDEKSR